ncbi:MAG: dihydroorotase [Candidatus Dormibacteria bacterium]
MRVIDPVAAVDLAGQDVWISEGRIIAMYRSIAEGTLPVVDLTPEPGRQPFILAPAFIDLHAHLREPGGEEAETVASGAAAAAAGGFGEVLAMANTSPPVDTPERVRAALALARQAAVRVGVVSAVTRDLQGREPVDVEGCAAAGAVAFSDDGRNAAPATVLAEVLRRASALGLPVLVHPEDEAQIDGTPATITRCSRRPASAEASAVSTAIEALREAGSGRLHLQHVSTAAAVDLIRAARADGLAVTAEVTPHHLAMWLPPARLPDPPSLLKVNPPLRSEGDRRAVVGALRDGTIDAVATDHAPHPAAAKRLDLEEAAPGMTGLETALATCITFGAMDGDWIPVLIERLTTGPHRVLGRPATASPRLAGGETASFTLFDPAAEWTVGEDARSRSSNTPLWGTRVRGRVVLTVVDGVTAFRDEARVSWPALAGATNG